MTTQKMISDLNSYLVTEQSDITIIDYVKLINKNIFDIDITFIDDFIDLVDKDGFNIPHEMLFKYEILIKTDSANVLRSLQNQNFEDGLDYSCSETVLDRSSKNKIIYMLGSDAFKIICMRSLKTKKYAQYYLLLEKCIFYYSQFEKLKLEHKIK